MSAVRRRERPVRAGRRRFIGKRFGAFRALQLAAIKLFAPQRLRRAVVIVGQLYRNARACQFSEMLIGGFNAIRTSGKCEQRERERENARGERAEQ